MNFYANIDSKSGPYVHDDAKGAAIGVLEAPDNRMPIGVALPSGRDDNGVALWRLFVRGVAIPGHWVVIDGEFRRPPGEAQ